MCPVQTAVVALLLLAVHGIAGQDPYEQNQKVIGKKEARLVLDELRNRHESHVLKRSAYSETELDDIDFDLIARALKQFEDTRRSSETSAPNQHETKDGEKLIQQALKGNVDPDSDVVNLLESMYVDEGSRHNQHPDGINKVASKKGKVFGDTHDGHRLTQQQIEELNQNDGEKRNFRKSASLWKDKIIPYSIDSSLSNDPKTIDVINKAIKQFSDYTCLSWVPRGSTEAARASYSSYIEFFSGSGCWSYVGRVFPGKQQISLQNPGCVSVSTTIHEMAHAIGQLHEQSRNDRDNYVTMLWSNIQGGKTNNNMAKSNTYDYNPYDYESVLQYSLKSFSTNGQPTMEFKDRRLDFLADAATGLMFYDIQDIVDAYNCTAPCRGADGNTPLKQCQNGGFVLHTCNCHCPDGLTGDLCQSVATDPECGPGIIDLADGESRTITSPNFDNGGPYPTGKKCVWLVKASAGKNVEMTIKEMDLTAANSACDHWLEIQYNLIGQTGPRRCGKLTKETYVTTDNVNPNLMLLKFDSAFASTATAGKGFNLTVSSVGGGCKGIPCVHGKCTDVGSNGFTCSCESGYSGKYCDTYVDTGDVFCGFEGTNCILTNPQRNSYDWIITAGSTPSSGTGPSGAKTGSHYLYVETSSPVPVGTKFQFESPLISAGPKCLRFWYHMYGSTMGTLSVLRNGTQLWTKAGDQGNAWHRGEIDVGTLAKNYKVTFEAIKGSEYLSDIAIDDVTLTSSTCNGQTSSPTVRPPTTGAPVTKAPTTVAPVTKAPTTVAPVTKAPTTVAPITKAPTTVAPVTYTPATVSPVTKTPATIFPVTPIPTTQTPITGSPEPPLIDQELHCSFETGTACFLSDIQEDDFDWRIRKGSTPSSRTGPTSAFEGQKYSYIEASGKKVNSVAILQGPSIKTTQTFCLTFAYHMYGLNIGSLSVSMASSNGDQSLFSSSGDAGNLWIVTSVSLPPSNGKIQFVGVRGDGFRGDIAIDDVHFMAGDCSTDIDCRSNPCGPNSVCVQESSTTYRCDCHPGFGGLLCDVVTGEGNCTFERNEDCFLENSKLDDFDWTIKSGKTPSSNTGPKSAVQGSRYAYIETSGRSQGQKASLVSKDMFENGDRCLTFKYHMYGQTIDSLRVLQETDTNTIELFSKYGQQSNSDTNWKTASIDIYHNTNDLVIFEATRGKSFTGDIAIDDIRYLPGRCACDSITCMNGGTCVNQQNGGTCQCPPTFTGHRCQNLMGLLVSCTFDDGSCFLTDITGLDSMDWKITKKRTPSSRTGPSKPLDGNYAYIEATGRRSGDNAILTSAVTSQLSPSSPTCLRFVYNMNGRNIGTLKVLAGERYSEQEIWALSGNQNDKWTPVSIDIPAFNDLVIKFEAIRGNGYRSDIAIDSIQLFDSPCTDVSLPA
ncbi:MAM and LDL-receptor class A domain-containing protein 1 isoform X2 [Magallana gigas]|uniref:MAM and LDL-receptor class A domain-containing protein 1 isoform X2 n=1 Tax=Magallana gigas TaxID=29159 RepID=UPI00333F2D6E